MANQFTPPSGAATTNHPAVIIAHHANTSRIIRDIVMIAHTVISTKRSAWRNLLVMADPIGHLPTSSPHQ